MVPVAANLLVLLQKLHREEQQIVKVEGIVCRQCLAVTPVDIGGELAPRPSALASSWSAAPGFWRC